MGLLASLGCVLGLAFAFFVIYRRHLRRLRSTAPVRSGRGRAHGRRQPVPFQMPSRWLAIRSSNTGLVRELLGVPEDVTVSWSEALSRAGESALFVSAPVDGWSLVVGGGLVDPVQDVDALYRMLNRLSRELGEVHCYAADRVLQFHTWARLDDGRVTRAYSWAGETLWNEGRPTLEERLLGFRCRAYCEGTEPPRYGEVSPEAHNTDRVVLLARRWSVDPVAASERLLQKETVRPEGEDISGD